MMKDIRNSLLLALAMFVLASATLAQPAKIKRPDPPKPAPTAQKIAQNGSYENGVYRNNWMGFSVAVPEGWNLTSEEINKATLKAGMDKIETEGPRQAPGSNAVSLARSSVLFQTLTIGAAITCGVELSPATGAVYLEHNKKLVLATNKGSVLIRNTYNKKLGGVVFGAFDIEMPKEGGTIAQTYLVTKRRNVILFFILTSYEGAGGDQGAEALDAIEFDK